MAISNAFFSLLFRAASFLLWPAAMVWRAMFLVTPAEFWPKEHTPHRVVVVSNGFLSDARDAAARLASHYRLSHADFGVLKKSTELKTRRKENYISLIEKKTGGVSFVVSAHLEDPHWKEHHAVVSDLIASNANVVWVYVPLLVTLWRVCLDYFRNWTLLSRSGSPGEWKAFKTLVRDIWSTHGSRSKVFFKEWEEKGKAMRGHTFVMWPFYTQK